MYFYVFIHQDKLKLDIHFIMLLAVKASRVIMGPAW